MKAVILAATAVALVLASAATPASAQRRGGGEEKGPHANPAEKPKPVIALQEDVDAIGISILSGAHMTVFPKVIALMKEKKMDDVLLTGGGIIPQEDMEELNAMGVGKLFAPGAAMSDIADYIREWVKHNRSF